MKTRLERGIRGSPERWTVSSRARAGFCVPLIILGLTGCRGLATLKQRCVAGEIEACESACAKGVVGEEGCFHAGDQHRRKAAFDQTSPELRLASRYFAKSCDGGYADGCLFAAQMIEARYAQLDLDAPNGSAPPMISDTEVMEREKRLGLACDYGSSVGCKRLGDILIGKNAVRADAAYKKSCQSSSDSASCLAARLREVETAEQWRDTCTHGAADACMRLGDLLYAVDPPRAYRLFASECQLRGVTAVAGGLGTFIRGRARQAAAGIPADPAKGAGSVPPGDSMPPLRISPAAVKGRVPVVEVDRALKEDEAGIQWCLGSLPKDFAGIFHVSMIIDLTGDVWRATVGDAPAKVAECLTPLLESIHVSTPGTDIGTATLTMSVGPSAHPAR